MALDGLEHDGYADVTEIHKRKNVVATFSTVESTPMKIPNSVIYVVGDVLGSWSFSHSKLFN